MAQDLAIVAVLVLALYGVADLIERVVFHFLFGKGGRQYLLVPLASSQTDGEYAVRRLTAARRFLPPCDKTVPLVVQYGEGRSELSRLCETVGAEYIGAEHLKEIIADGLQAAKKEV